MKTISIFIVFQLCCFYMNSQSKEALLNSAKSGNEEAFIRIYENYEIASFDHEEDRVFLANMRMLKIRTYEILRGQYYDLLNGFWGGQKPGVTETIREVPLCHKKFKIIVNIPYVYSKDISESILDMLTKERAIAADMINLKKELIGNSVHLVTNKLTAPTWNYIPQNASASQAETISRNNREASEKAMERIGDWTTLISGVFVAQALDEKYQEAQTAFLKALPETFGEEIGAIYEKEYRKHCDQTYAKNKYEEWFTKEYLEISDQHYSAYKFDEYFDTNRPIDGYRLWIDSNYKPESLGNLMSQIIYSGRYYAFKLALQRGVSLDIPNTKGKTARQVLNEQGAGFVQNQMRKLMESRDANPQSFASGIPEKDIAFLYDTSDTVPLFDAMDGSVQNLKVLTVLDGPLIRKGQRVHLRTNGSIFLGGVAGESGPEGIDGLKNYNLLANVKHGALVFRISKRGTWKALNSGGTFNASNSGLIQFAVNDKGYQNNSGGYNIQLIIDDKGVHIEKDTPAPNESKPNTELSSLSSEKAEALAKNHSRNCNGVGVVFYSNREATDVSKTIKELNSFFTSRDIKNPRVLFSKPKGDGPDRLSIYVNSKQVLNKGDNDSFLRKIEQILTYQRNGQFLKSKG